MSIEVKQAKGTESQSKKINFQMDLFEEFTEYDALYNEVESLRTSVHKLRRKLFRELDEMNAELKEMREDNMKMKFYMFHEEHEDRQRL